MLAYLAKLAGLSENLGPESSIGFMKLVYVVVKIHWSEIPESIIY